jgi:hypothetical protein
VETAGSATPPNTRGSESGSLVSMRPDASHQDS